MKETVKSFLYVNISNVLFILSSMLIQFLIPIFFSVEDYYDFKIMTFYMGFVSLFHLGIVDGINVKFKSYDKDEFKNVNIKSIFKIHILISLMFTFALIVINYFFLNIPFLYFSILFVLPVNTIGIITTIMTCNKLYGYVSVIKLLPKIVILIAIVFSISVFNSNILIVISSYFIYPLFIIVMFLFLYRDELSVKHEKVIDFKLFFSLIKVGFPLVVSYSIYNLALGLDRIFIENNHSELHYTFYAFANSILLIFIQLFKSTSTLLLPYLSRSESSENTFILISYIINVLFSSLLLMLFIIPIGINWIIPKMIYSIPSLYILLASAIFQINFFLVQRVKLLLKNKVYSVLIFNIVLLAISLFTNFIVYMNNFSYVYYAVSTVISFLVCFILIEIFLTKIYKSTNIIIITPILISSMFIYSILFSFDILYYIVTLLLLITSLIQIAYWRKSNEKDNYTSS